MPTTRQPIHQPVDQFPRENISEYVAHLQLHMALQARNLVPSLASGDAPEHSRQSLLQQTQADIEKMISRQAF